MTVINKSHGKNNEVFSGGKTYILHGHTQSIFTCSKLAIETLEQNISIVDFEQVNTKLGKLFMKNVIWT